MLHKRDVAMSKDTARIRETTHKHSTQSHRNIKGAETLDIDDNNAFWKDAIENRLDTALHTLYIFPRLCMFRVVPPAPIPLALA